MKSLIMSTAIAAVVAGWAAPSIARESIALPNVVGTEGELNGVDTTGAGSLTIGNNQNININNDLLGGLTSDGNATATLLFNGNSTVTGFTGTDGNRFLVINAGAPASTVNFNGNVFSQILNVTGTGTVNFNGNTTSATNFVGDGFINLAANRTLIGAVTTNTANTGTLTLNSGSNVTGAIGGASGIKLINVAGNSSITGAVQTLGLNLGANTLNITGDLTTNAGGTIATTLASNTVFGRVIFSAGQSLINAGGITVTPTVTGALTVGTTFRIVDAPAGTILAPVFVVNNSPRFQFSGVPTTTGDVTILLTAAAPLANFATTPGALAVAPTLDINALAGSDLLAIQDAIAVLPTGAAINNALAQLAPGTTNLAAPWVAGQTTRMFEDLWMARMEEIQGLCCDDKCGPNQPNPALNKKCTTPNHHGNWWVKGFGNSGQQDNVNGQTGYDTKAYGVMVAYDMALNDKTRVGFGGGYANTTVESNDSIGRTKIDSYQLTGYFDHRVGTAFVQGALTAGIDKYDGSRSIVFPGVNRNASADFDGEQYSALVSVGKHFAVNEIIVTPTASLQVSRISVDGYTEQGAGAASLRVASQDYDFVQSGLGVKAERVMKSGNVTFSPEVHYKWLHDFKSTTMHQDASFTGGGGTFSAEGIKQDRDLHNIGAGITFLSCNCSKESWSVKALYDYKWNQSDYSSHQVSLIGGMKF